MMLTIVFLWALICSVAGWSALIFSVLNWSTDKFFSKLFNTVMFTCVAIDTGLRIFSPGNTGAW